MVQFEPRIVGFLCQWCACEGADAAGRARLDVPANLRAIRVPCSGRVSPGLVLEAFSHGADGVLILGCRPGECHYRDGNSRAMARVVLLRRVMAPLGIEPERLGLEWVAAGEGERFAQVVLDMVKRLRRLGPLGRFAERGRLSWRPDEEAPFHVPSAENTAVFLEEADS